MSSVDAKKAITNARNNFRKKYPIADMSRFSFEARATRGGGVGVITRFVLEDGITTFDIRYDGFKENKEYTKYLTIKYPSVIAGKWSEMWLANGQVQRVIMDDSSDPFTFPRTRPFTVESFKVFANSHDYFSSKLPPIEDLVEIDGVDVEFDYKKPYFASLSGSYIATYLSGVCTKHLTTSVDVYPVITSVMNFHVYFWISRFIHDPELLKPYLNKLGEVKGHIPQKTVWVSKSDKYRVTYDYGTAYEKGSWIEKQKSAGKHVRNVSAHQVMSVNGFLTHIKINYEEMISTKLSSKSDYKRFLADETTGFTKTGQLLLNESIEAFNYAVLGAQARTRWPIVGEMAKSSQTQLVFRKIVKDTITQNDSTITISNMRTAIRDTNVVLNTALTPGVVLVPSSLVILKKSIPGYNNILTIATNSMKRGVNRKVNYTGSPNKEPKKLHQEEAPTAHLNSLDNNDVILGEEPTAHPNIQRSTSTLPEKSSSQLDVTTITIVSGVVSFVSLKYIL